MLVFGGRSTRTEAVGFFLLCSAANMMTVTVAGPGAALMTAAKIAWSLLWGWPWLALFVRRLHDQDRSGWWALSLAALPLAAMIAMAMPQSPDTSVTVRFLGWVSHPATPFYVALEIIVVAVLAVQTAAMFLQYGTSGPNRFGADPREAAASPPAAA